MKWNKINCIILHFKLILYILFFLPNQVIQTNSIRLPPHHLMGIDNISETLSQNKSSF